MPKLNRVSVSASWLAGLVAAVSCSQAAAQPFQPSVDGLVVMEAEHYSLNVAQGSRTWSESLIAGYVGDSAMQALPDTGAVVQSTFQTEAPRLDFEVEFAGPATLYVWLRGYGPGWNADSVWIGVDGEAAGVLLASPPKTG